MPMPKGRKSFQPQGNKTPTTDVQPDLTVQHVFFEVGVPGERTSSVTFLPTITESKDMGMSEKLRVVSGKEDAHDLDEEVNN